MFSDLMNVLHVHSASGDSLSTNSHEEVLHLTNLPPIVSHEPIVVEECDKTIAVPYIVNESPQTVPEHVLRIAVEHALHALMFKFCRGWWPPHKNPWLILQDIRKERRKDYFGMQLQSLIAETLFKQFRFPVGINAGLPRLLETASIVDLTAQYVLQPEDIYPKAWRGTCRIKLHGLSGRVASACQRAPSSSKYASFPFEMRWKGNGVPSLAACASDRVLANLISDVNAKKSWPYDWKGLKRKIEGLTLPQNCIDDLVSAWTDFVESSIPREVKRSPAPGHPIPKETMENLRQYALEVDTERVCVLKLADLKMQREVCSGENLHSKKFAANQDVRFAFDLRESLTWMCSPTAGQFLPKVGPRSAAVVVGSSKRLRPRLIVAGYANSRSLVDFVVANQNLRWDQHGWECVPMRLGEDTFNYWKRRLRQLAPRPGDCIVIDALSYAFWDVGGGLKPGREADKTVARMVEAVANLAAVAPANVRVVVLGPLPRLRHWSLEHTALHELDYQWMSSDYLEQMCERMTMMRLLEWVDEDMRHQLRPYPQAVVVGANSLAERSIACYGHAVNFYREALKQDGISFRDRFWALIASRATDIPFDNVLQMCLNVTDVNDGLNDADRNKNLDQWPYHRQ